MLYRKRHPLSSRPSTTGRVPSAHAGPGLPGAKQSSQTDKGLQPPGPVCAPYRRAYYPGPCGQEGSPRPGIMLSRLPGTGGGARTPEHRFLLYLHRRISLSKPGSRRDRRDDSERFLEQTDDFHREGDFQCF